MAMSQNQLDQELKRKARLGLTATNPQNQGRVDALKTQLGIGQPALNTKPVQPKPVTPPAGMVGVRDYLSGAGIGGIGFKDGMVTFDGGSLKPGQVVNNRAYANASDLDAAINRVRTNQTQGKVNELLGRLETSINTQPTLPTFNYDPTTDPVYQAALRRAQANAQTATNNALVSLGSRGIGNSGSAVTAASQIQQRELGRVSDEVLPQLYQQAYTRFQDERDTALQQRRAQIEEISNLLGLTNQQAQQFIDQAERDRSFNRGVLESDRAFDYGKERDARGDFVDDRNFDRGVFESDRGFNRGVLESDRNFNRGVLESDRNYNLDVRQTNSSIGNAAADNRRADEAAGRAARNDEEARLFRIWEATGIAPAGIDGVAPGTPLAGSQPKPEQPSTRELESEYVGNLNKLSDERLAEFFNAEEANIINDLGIEGYNRLYNRYYDEYGNRKKKN